MLPRTRLYLAAALFSLCSLAALPILAQAVESNLAALKLSHRLVESFPDPSYWYFGSLPARSLNPPGGDKRPVMLGDRAGNIPLYRLAGIDKLASGGWIGAEKSFRAVLSRDPQDVVARFWLGQSLLRQGRPEDAVREWAALGSGLPFVYAGERYLSAGQVEEGLTWVGLGLQVAQASQPSPVASEVAGLAFHDFADVYRERGDASRTILYMEKALDYLPERVDYRFDLAQYYLREGRFAEALVQIEFAEKIFPGSTIAPGIRGEAYLQLGDLTGAEKAFDECLARKFDQHWHARAYIGLSFLFARRLDWEQSITAADQAIEVYHGIDPGWRFQLEMNFQAALKAEPDRLEWYLWIGDLYRKAGEPSQARVYYELARDRWPENRELIERLK